MDKRATRGEGGVDVARHRRLFEAVCANATVAIFLLDERRRCVYMNPAAEELTGFALAEAQGRTLHDLVHHTRPDGSPYPIAECPIVRAFPENKRAQGEEVFVHKDGRFYPVAYTASPIREAGVIVGTILEVRDISEQKRAEEKLRASKEQLAAIFGQTTAGLARTDLGGRFTLVNDRYCEMVGRSRAELLGLRMQDITHPEDLPRNLALFRRAIETGEAFVVEKRYLRPDGAVVWVSNSVSLIRDRRGSPQAMLAASIDVTDRKRAEDELRASEARLAAVLDCLPVGVGFVDTAGRLVLSNQEMRRYVPEVIPSRDEARHDRWRAHHPDGRLLEPSEYPGARALRGETVLPGVEFLHTQDDGLEIWTRVAAVPLRDAGGRVTGAVAVVTDIDAEKRAQEELKALLAAKERLAQHNELIAREMGHRIMNSFQMLNSLFSMQTRRVADPVAREAVDAALARIQAMAVVQRQLFQAAREDAGTLDLGAYLESLARELVASFAGDRCDLRAEIPLGISVKTERASPLGMIVTELVINACKHAFGKDGTGTLTVRLEPSGSGYRLHVADDGPGLPQGLDLARSRGLGMKLVQSLVRQLEGSLEIDGRPPGTRFFLTFPA